MVALVTALVVAVSGAGPATATAVPQTYATPGTYSFTVPSGVTTLRFDVFGAEGGRGGFFRGAAGAKGGEAIKDVAVTPGQVFQIRVGGKGGDASAESGGSAGPNGGGAGPDGGGAGSGGGGGGGGASDVRGPGCGTTCALSNRIVVGAGGGGGGGQGVVNVLPPDQYGRDGGRGGTGGGDIGGTGGPGIFGKGGYGGTGGTESAGGTKGNNGLGCSTPQDTGTNGGLGVGGKGRLCAGGGGGGGGGGYYGGGGGGAGSYGSEGGYGGGGGGGGSSFSPTGYTVDDEQAGNGKVVITVPPTTTTTTVPPPPGSPNIFAANSGSITEYESITSTSPAATISGAGTVANPKSLAADSAGTLWVAMPGGVARFAPGSSGSTPPVALITGSHTGLDNPWGIALGPGGSTIFVTSGNAVLEFAATANGDVAPLRTISGSNTGLSFPTGVALDAARRIYVSNFSAANVTVYAPDASGDVAPIATLPVAADGGGEAASVAVGADGKVWVSGQAGSEGRILRYRRNPTGTYTHDASIAGSNTGLDGVGQIAVDTQGVYVVNETSNPYSLLRFATTANGNVAPTGRISGSSSGLSSPIGLALRTSFVPAAPPETTTTTTTTSTSTTSTTSTSTTSTTTVRPAPHPQSLPGVVTASTGWSLRDSLTLGGPTVGPFTFGAKPPALVPLSGDWDGGGVKTPGIFQAGVFKLSNANAANPTPADSFTFGDPQGFPVSGDFNGDGVDDVAVYRAGTWEKRLSTGATSSFSFGAGTWPSVVPVAGDWNGDGTDGIGLYCRDNVTCPAGTWMLRNTAMAGTADAGTFVYNPGTTPYPVVGDWNADGTDTVGVRSGTTWLLKNTNTAGNTADIPAFDFGAANDLPIVWAK